VSQDALFDAVAIDRLLRELAAELDHRGVKGRMFVVGGAAMALAYGRDRVTRDIDAVFEPKEEIYRIARMIAARHGLAADWLKDGVKGFMHGADPDATVVFDEPGLSLEVASPRYLFTMKALAARVDRDARDLQWLYQLCGFTSVADALDHLERTAPAAWLTTKSRFLVQELLQEAT